MNTPQFDSVYLAFDYGHRRTGVAVGQSITGTATPLQTLEFQHDSPDWEAINSLIESWKPGALIVGVPDLKSADDSTHPLLKKMDDFCTQIALRYDLPVYRINETLTSAVAYDGLRDKRRQGKRKRINKKDIDALAAAIMLESWMSELKNPRYGTQHES